jgi:hypothetical protein
MPITDNIIYRLKPESGDTSPHNEIGGGSILSGGTIALVDRGSGDYAWQFSGTDSTATGVSKTLTPADAAGGMTMAVTIKVVTNPTVDFTRYIQFQKTTDPNVFMGMTQNGANAVRGRYINSGSSNTAFSGVGATEFTFVHRIKTNGASASSFESWKKTTGRVGVTPDVTGSTVVDLTNTFATLLVGGLNNVVLQIKDWIIWDRELTDTECANVADDLRGIVDAASGVTISCAIGNAVADGLIGVINQEVVVTGVVGDAIGNGSTATVTNNSDVTISCGIGGATSNGVLANIAFNITVSSLVGDGVANGSTAAITNTTQFITDIIINNTGTALANQAVYWTWFPLGRIGSLSAITSQDGTGTTSGIGRLTVTGLSQGDGLMLVSVRNTSATDDYVYYQAGTVA